MQFTERRARNKFKDGQTVQENRQIINWMPSAFWQRCSRRRRLPVHLTPVLCCFFAAGSLSACVTSARFSVSPHTHTYIYIYMNIWRGRGHRYRHTYTRIYMAACCAKLDNAYIFNNTAVRTKYASNNMTYIFYSTLHAHTHMQIHQYICLETHAFFPALPLSVTLAPCCPFRRPLLVYFCLYLSMALSLFLYLFLSLYLCLPLKSCWQR